MLRILDDEYNDHLKIGKVDLFHYETLKHWHRYVQHVMYVLHVKACNENMFSRERFKNFLRYLARIEEQRLNNCLGQDIAIKI